MLMGGEGVRHGSKAGDRSRLSGALLGTGLLGVGDLEILGDHLDPLESLELGKIKAARRHFLPLTSCLMVLPHDRGRKDVKLGRTLALERGVALRLVKIIADVQEDHDDVVEGVERLALYREAAVAVGGEPTFYLNPDL